MYPGSPQRERTKKAEMGTIPVIPAHRKSSMGDDGGDGVIAKKGLTPSLASPPHSQGPGGAVQGEGDPGGPSSQSEQWMQPTPGPRSPGSCHDAQRGLRRALHSRTAGSLLARASLLRTPHAMSQGPFPLSLGGPTSQGSAIWPSQELRPQTLVLDAGLLVASVACLRHVPVLAP